MPKPDAFPTRPAIAAGPIFAPQLPLGLQGDLPLRGMTLLAVEDSRFTCEALRLMCLRAGARLRRAETMEAARAHLRVYRPDVVIVDLGLPDGRGEGLIRELVLSENRPSVVLGTSGNPDGRASALAAGAQGFLDKPIESLAMLCQVLRRLMPHLGLSPALPDDDRVMPDPLALQDDLALAAQRLHANPGPAEQRYVTGFLRGIARHAHDTALEDAACDAQSATGSQPARMEELRRLVDHRLTSGAAAFRADPGKRR